MKLQPTGAKMVEFGGAIEAAKSTNKQRDKLDLQQRSDNDKRPPGARAFNENEQPADTKLQCVALKLHAAQKRETSSQTSAEQPEPAPGAKCSQRLEAAKQATGRGLNVCAGCARPIREQFLLEALGKRWHEDCLKCACCECRLGEVGSSLFVHLDKIFCRRDFLRIFGQRGQCALCSRPIEPYELVMRAKGHAYHLECFSCQQCQSRFCVGDQFCLWEPNKIVCFHCHQAASNSGAEQQATRHTVALAASKAHQRPAPPASTGPSNNDK